MIPNIMQLIFNEFSANPATSQMRTRSLNFYNFLEQIALGYNKLFHLFPLNGQLGQKGTDFKSQISPANQLIVKINNDTKNESLPSQNLINDTTGEADLATPLNDVVLPGLVPIDRVLNDSKEKPKKITDTGVQSLPIKGHSKEELNLQGDIGVIQFENSDCTEEILPKTFDESNNKISRFDIRDVQSVKGDNEVVLSIENLVVENEIVILQDKIQENIGEKIDIDPKEVPRNNSLIDQPILKEDTKPNLAANSNNLIRDTRLKSSEEKLQELPSHKGEVSFINQSINAAKSEPNKIEYSMVKEEFNSKQVSEIEVNKEENPASFNRHEVKGIECKLNKIHDINKLTIQGKLGQEGETLPKVTAVDGNGDKLNLSEVREEGKASKKIGDIDLKLTIPKLRNDKPQVEINRPNPDRLTVDERPRTMEGAHNLLNQPDSPISSIFKSTEISKSEISSSSEYKPVITPEKLERKGLEVNSQSNLERGEPSDFTVVDDEPNSEKIWKIDKDYGVTNLKDINEETKVSAKNSKVLESAYGKVVHEAISKQQPKEETFNKNSMQTERKTGKPKSGIRVTPKVSENRMLEVSKEENMRIITEKGSTQQVDVVIKYDRGNLNNALETFRTVLVAKIQPIKEPSGVRNTKAMTFLLQSEDNELIEIKFMQEEGTNRGKVIVDSEILAVNLQKHIPVILQNLESKGVHFEELAVQLNNTENKESGYPNRQKVESKREGMIKQEETENVSETTPHKAVYYGYNTIDYIA